MCCPTVTPQKRVRCIGLFQCHQWPGTFFRFFPGRLFCRALAAAFRLSPARSLCALLLLPDILYLLLSRSFREVRAATRFPSRSFFSALSYSSARRTGAGLTVESRHAYTGLHSTTCLKTRSCSANGRSWPVRIVRPLFAEQQEKAMREMPRDDDIIALFNAIGGAGSLPPAASHGVIVKREIVSLTGKLQCLEPDV